MGRGIVPLGQSHRRQAWTLGVVGILILLVASTYAGLFAPFGPLLPSSSSPASGSGGVGLGGGSSSGPSPAAISPFLSVAPAEGVVGTLIYLNATGYAHGVGFSITTHNPATNGTLTACSGTTSSTGTYSCTYLLPPTPGGHHNFTGTDAKGNAYLGAFTVRPNLAPNPSSGLVGTAIDFLGTGFGGKVTTHTKNGTTITNYYNFGVSVTWTPPGGGPVSICPGTSSNASTGSFSCNYTMIAAPAGAHAFTASATNVTLSATANFTVQAGLTDAPTHGPPLTSVSFGGTGYPANSSVVVAGTGALGTACSATSLSTGSFSCSYTIPKGTTGGAYTFTASSGSSRASTGFTVTNLTVSPVGAPVNSTVAFSGGGFDADEPVSISWAFGTVCPTQNSSAAGAVSCTFRIPDEPAGAYLVNASQPMSGDYATTYLTIEPFLVLNQTYGEPPVAVRFSGSGFAASSAINVSWSPASAPTTACTTTSSSLGLFSCTFTIPGGTPGGPYTFTATDALSHSASGTFGVSLLTATPGTGTNGTKVLIRATGFAPSVAISVTSSLGFSCIGAEMTGSLGGYECNATLPNASAGRYLVQAQAGHDTAYTNLTVVPHLWAKWAVASDAQVVGGTVRFVATGFASGATVTVAWPNGTEACTGSAGAAGLASCNYTVPASPAGSYRFFASDSSGNSAGANVVVGPLLKATPASGVEGTSVDFLGTGFGASLAVNVTSTLGSACSLSTFANGTFACPYTVPAAPSGTYVFRAVDTASNSNTTKFALGATLSVSPSSAPVGTLLVFTGTGFGAGRTANVTWNYTASPGVKCSATVSPSGGFGCTFSVPEAPVGSYLFTAKDGTGTTANHASVLFNLTAALSVAPSSGPVGTTVQFVGTGYPVATLVSVSWSGGPACSTSSNASGTFSCLYTIPATTAGPHTFTAAAGAKVSASTVFTVTPTLSLTPASGAVGTTILLNGSGYAASAGVTVDWTGGTACTVTTSVVGSFSCAAYLVPPTPAGAYLFTAVVNGTGVATASFSVVASLTMNPSAGPVGTKVAFRATGFGDAASVTISSSLGTACAGAAAANGTFLCSYTLPAAPGGAYLFTATDGTNTASASFMLGTVLSVSPTLGTVGTAVRFTATAFAADTAITITWSGGTVAGCSGTTGPAGGFTCNATIPAAALGSHTFTATAGPSATTTFTVRPALAVTPTSAGSGATIAFLATGFPALTGVTVSWSGPTSCSGSTAANGTVSCSLVIPLGTAGGLYQFTATDSFLDTANATFDVVTGLAASPNHGPATTAVTFTGSNFAAVESVTLASSLATVCTAMTNASGGFTCGYTIPSGTPGGTYNFTATGTADSASVLFVVTSLSASPSGVTVGTHVAISGAGFTPSTPYTVTDPWGSVCSGTTSGTGAIACTATVQGSAVVGDYNFSASDGTDVARAPFGVLSVSAPTANRTSADVGQSVHFSVAATGNGTLQYLWAGLPTGCSGTGASFTCSPSAPTNASVSVKITDAAGFFVTTSALAFVVYPDPSQAPASPSLRSADLGQTVTFTASVSGGSGGGAYVWSAAGLNCTATTGAVLTCVPATAGSFSVSYAWTDGNGRAASGATALTYVANPLPTQAPPTPTRSAADVGQRTVFTATVAGGASGGSYAWTTPSGLGCTPSTGPTISCDPTAANSYTVSFQWTDGNGIGATGATSLSFTVDGAPVVGTPTASKSSVDVNQSVTFSVTASGGAGTLSYTWNGLPTGCSGSAASFSCTPQAAGSGFTITVTVTDGNDFNVTSVPVASFTVYADPTVTTPGATPSSVDAGQSVTISVTASSGAGGYSYVWSGLPAACGTPTTDSVTCTPTAAIASTSITVKVTDGNGYAVTSEALVFTVFSDPSQAPPTPSSSSSDLGQTVTFSAVVSGGSGGGSYSWTAAGLNCSATDGAVLSCTPTTAGGFSVSFQWTDSNGESASGSTSLSFTVYAVPTVTSVAPTDNNKSADVGQKVSFTATASGGPDGLTYTWTESSLEFNCTFTAGATASCTAKASGSYNLTVYVTDSNGVRSATVRSAEFTVYVAPTVSVPNPSRSSSDVQQQVDFSVSASGGSGSPTYTWKYSPTTLGCMSGSTATLMCTPTVAGSYSVSVYVTDSNGVASPTESTTYTVDPAPSLTIPTFSTSRNVMDTNRTVTFTTIASGGSGAYTFTWTVVSGLGCTVVDAAAISCVPTVSGSYSVTVSAVDSNGAAANAETLQTFTVYYAPAATAPIANRTSVDVNYTVSFNTTVSGGDGKLAYQWNNSNPAAMNCAPISATDHLVIVCTPRTAGTYTVWVNVTDTLGVVSPNAEVNFTVYSRPTVLLVSDPHGSILQGHSVTFSASASGGYGNYTYSWGDLPAGCAPTHKTTITCTPTGAGTFVVIVSIQDANDGSSIANLTFTVNPAFLGLPAVEGYAIVGGIVVAAVVAAAVGVLLVMRRHRGRRQETQF